MLWLLLLRLLLQLRLRLWLQSLLLLRWLRLLLLFRLRGIVCLQDLDLGGLTIQLGTRYGPATQG